MFEQLLVLLGVKKGAILLAAFFGALVSLLAFPEVKTWSERIVMVVVGTLCAVYGTPLIGVAMTMTEPMERGFSFMVGLVGLTAMKKIFEAIKDTKFGEIISGWLKRPGS